jgi:hypothetical protein
MNVITSLLGLVIVSHLSPKGSGRFKGKLTSLGDLFPMHVFSKVSAPYTLVHY